MLWMFEHPIIPHYLSSFPHHEETVTKAYLPIWPTRTKFPDTFDQNLGQSSSLLILPSWGITWVTTHLFRFSVYLIDFFIIHRRRRHYSTIVSRLWTVYLTYPPYFVVANYLTKPRKMLKNENFNSCADDDKPRKHTQNCIFSHTTSVSDMC